MARSSLDPSLMPEEHHQAPVASVTLEVTTNMDLDDQLVSTSSNDSNCYLTNSADIALHQIQSSNTKMDEQSEQGGIDGSDQLMNPGATTPMSNAEMMNLLISRQKQEQEQQLKNISNHPVSYSCTLQTSEEREETKLETEGKNSKKSMLSPPSLFSHQQDTSNESTQEYYSTLANNDPQSSYEVTTFVTEDGQNGQVIISGNNTYASDLSVTDGAVSLGENNITTIQLPDGQILSLGKEQMEEIAGLGNFTGGSIQFATTQASDGTTQLQYILKPDGSMKEDQYATTQQEKKTFQCDIDNCTKEFSTPYRLKAHGRTHSGDTFTCFVCRKPFGTQSDLQKHSKTHLGQKDFICEEEGCKKEYTTAHHLKVHKRQHSGERPFVCEWEGCGKMFTTGYGLKSHFRTHTNERPYKCTNSSCTKAFKTSGDLQKHIRTHTGERPFTCPYEGCSRSFTTSNIRKVHLRTHTGEKPYKCEIETCGRTFASATNYKNHSRIHTGERPYVCEVAGCLKRFTEYSSLYKHNIVHTQQKPYTCTLCHKTYRQTSTLAMHKRTVHGTEDLTDTEKRENVLVPVKRPKITPSSRLTPVTSSSTTTGYLQGMSLVINNSSSGDQSFTAEISSQHLPESSEIPGAIAIPIQVTMNADGTIAGAQGLNLTDGSGRMIPVNLSVSIPMSSFPPMNNTSGGATRNQQVEANIVYPQNDDVIDMLPDNEVAPRHSSSASEDGDHQLTPRMLSEQVLVTSSMESTQTNTTSSPLMRGVLNANRQIIRLEQLPEDNFDVDGDDVTDKYLTSHYRKDVKTVPY